ncbi:hypothetical protein [Paraburkholderia domus]|uniref:hypothetical protein n=1 Tax=Paraburkholderia domus TaxID=2793075 RepID=UPI0019148DCA|nr:hypothetical protein [Paraburkholderia domus]MBK5061768.1 hypothetical protein [Burkholderia sp. R-70199]CAE6900105.1 hypothetical protein R70199_03644 [Paraburkholderia domus]
MTPEDKELLGRAALIAGAVMTDYSDRTRDHWMIRHADDTWRPWNPLEDDGDALRLANRLRISITMYNEGVTTRHFSRVTRTLGSEIGREDAATRRAIVTAAAAMWLDHVDEMDKGEIAPAAIAGGGWSALKMVVTNGDGRLVNVPREA